MPVSQLRSLVRAIEHALRLESGARPNPEVELDTVNLTNDVQGRGSYAPVAQYNTTWALDSNLARVDVSGGNLSPNLEMTLIHGVRPDPSHWRTYSHIQLRVTGGTTAPLVTVSFQHIVTLSIMEIFSDVIPNPGLVVLTDVRVPPDWALRVRNDTLAAASDDLNVQLIGQNGPPGTAMMGT